MCSFQVDCDHNGSCIVNYQQYQCLLAMQFTSLISHLLSCVQLIQHSVRLVVILLGLLVSSTNKTGRHDIYLLWVMVIPI